MSHHNSCSCEGNNCHCDENCTCGCQEGLPCTCGCNCDCGNNQNKEIAFELCRTLIEGRTYTAEGIAEAFKKIYEAVKNCD